MPQIKESRLNASPVYPVHLAGCWPCGPVDSTLYIRKATCCQCCGCLQPADFCCSCCCCEHYCCCECCQCCDLRRSVCLAATWQGIIGGVLGSGYAAITALAFHNDSEFVDATPQFFAFMIHLLVFWWLYFLAGIVGCCTTLDRQGIFTYDPRIIFMSRLYVGINVLCAVCHVILAVLNKGMWGNPITRINIFMTFLPLVWDWYILYLAWSLARKLREQRKGVFHGRPVMHNQRKPGQLLELHSGHNLALSPPPSQVIVPLAMGPGGQGPGTTVLGAALHRSTLGYRWSAPSAVAAAYNSYIADSSGSAALTIAPTTHVIEHTSHSVVNPAVPSAGGWGSATVQPSSEAQQPSRPLSPAPSRSRQTLSLPRMLSQPPPLSLPTAVSGCGLAVGGGGVEGVGGASAATGLLMDGGNMLEAIKEEEGSSTQGALFLPYDLLTHSYQLEQEQQPPTIKRQHRQPILQPGSWNRTRPKWRVWVGAEGVSTSLVPEPEPFLPPAQQQDTSAPRMPRVAAAPPVASFPPTGATSASPEAMFELRQLSTQPSFGGPFSGLTPRLTSQPSSELRIYSSTAVRRCDSLNGGQPRNPPLPTLETVVLSVPEAVAFGSALFSRAASMTSAGASVATGQTVNNGDATLAPYGANDVAAVPLRPMQQQRPSPGRLESSSRRALFICQLSRQRAHSAMRPEAIVNSPDLQVTSVGRSKPQSLADSDSPDVSRPSHNPFPNLLGGEVQAPELDLEPDGLAAPPHSLDSAGAALGHGISHMNCMPRLAPQSVGGAVTAVRRGSASACAGVGDGLSGVGQPLPVAAVPCNPWLPQPPPQPDFKLTVGLSHFPHRNNDDS